MLPGPKNWPRPEPGSDLRLVKQMLRETDEGKTLLRLSPLFSVRGAREIRPYLERCDRGGLLNSEELLEVRDTLKTARQIRNTLVETNQSGKNNYSELFTLKEIVGTIVPQKKIEDEISRCISEDGNINDGPRKNWPGCGVPNRPRSSGSKRAWMVFSETRAIKRCFKIMWLPPGATVMWCR